MGNEKGLTGGTEACGCGWKRPLIGITTLEGTLPPERVVPVYNCPCCGTFYVPVELSEEAAASVFANLMSTAQPIERSEPRDPGAVEVLTSVDGGEHWIKGPLCGERNQVEALARGYREFVSHRSRAHEYPHGILVRWRNEVIS